MFAHELTMLLCACVDSADVWLTVPAAWDAKGCGIMREAAITAGLVQNARAGDRNWRDRLRIIRFGAYFVSWRFLMRLSDNILPSHEYSEPEAAAVHCAHLTNLHQLKPSQNFMICDAGGGTVVCITLESSSPFRTYLLTPFLNAFYSLSFAETCTFVQDLAVYRIIGELQSLEIAEVCARSGANCGSIFL